MWWVTGKIEFGAAFGVVELLYKPIQYYLHERIWYRWISYGLIKVKSKEKKLVKKTENIPSRKINEHLQEILSQPKVIKEGIQPEKVIKTEPIILKESVLGISELPKENIKRLTYTKKSD
jgi:uncharacterized membrane protein